MIQKIIRPLAVLILLTGGAKAFAQEVTIFDIRKPLAMSNDEKVYKDFFINAGTERGIKTGVVITVTRRRSLYDAYQNKSPGDIMIPVGRLKIIHTQKGLSVGRVYSYFSRDQLPTLDYSSLMVGDRLDISTMKMISSKKKTASAPQKSQSAIKSVVASPAHGPLNAVDFASRLPEKKEAIKVPSMQ